MTGAPSPSRAALLAVSAFGLLSLVGGWLIVYGGGFRSQLGKHGGPTVFVDGLPALVMALLQFLAAVLAFSWVLRAVLPPGRAALVAVVLVVAPPLLYLMGPVGG